jgi:hypothetical protein
MPDDNLLTIAKAVEVISDKAAAYKLLRDYYYGKHRAMFMSTEYSDNYYHQFAGLRCNMCARVVDAVVDRLSIKGFSVDEAGDGNEGEGATERIIKAVDRIWKRNRMDQRAGEAHQEAARMGDAYLIVWRSPDDPTSPIIYPNRAEMMTVTYDEEIPGRITSAAKCWVQPDGFTRLTLFYPDRIERWISKEKQSAITSGKVPDKANQYKHYQPDERTAWREDNPYGVVPVFHLSNNANIGMFGHSELHDVIPLQDMLNKSLMDEVVSLEFNSYPQRYAIGLDVDIDDTTGQPKKPFAPGRDRFWAVASTPQETQFGEFSSTDPTPLEDVVMGTVRKIALVSGTPLHYFNLQTGDFPSGEALKTAEAPFVAKLRDRQVSWGNVWEDAVAFALAIADVAKQGSVRLICDWEDAAPHSDKEQADTLTAHDKLKNNPVLMEKLGYTEDEVDRMQEAARANMPMIPTVAGPPSDGNDKDTPTPPQAGSNAQAPIGNAANNGRAA